VFPEIRPQSQQSGGVGEAAETHDVGGGPEVVAAVVDGHAPVLDVGADEEQEADDELLVAELQDEVGEDGDPERGGVGDGVGGKVFEEMGLLVWVGRQASKPKGGVGGDEREGSGQDESDEYLLLY
jgi:hypothetical protein